MPVPEPPRPTPGGHDADRPGMDALDLGAPDTDAPDFGGPAATGSQYRLARAGAEAVVVGLAGALRTYRVHGVDLTEPYGADTVPPAGNGIQLSPWPNRVAGARWELDGVAQQLDVTEPSRGHASHGLLRSTHFTPEHVSAHEVRLRAEIHPQHGWPFRLTHRVGYALGEDGALTVTMELENHSAATAPVAFGAHPFLRLGEVPSEELLLRVPADSWIRTGEDLIPLETCPVDGTAHDLRAGAPVGAAARDVCLTGLTPDADGRHRQTLTAQDGRSVTLWSDQDFAYTHVFVTDRLPGRPVAVAVEPLTAPADALNSGEGLHRLAPGARWSAQWGLTAHIPSPDPSSEGPASHTAQKEAGA